MFLSSSPCSDLVAEEKGLKVKFGCMLGVWWVNVEWSWVGQSVVEWVRVLWSGVEWSGLGQSGVRWVRVE